VLVDEVIESGTSLYIPQGFPHAATTGESASAHLTVGILTHDSSDVLKEIVHLASEEPIFGERIDVRDVESLAAEVDRHVDELRTWLDKLDRDELTTRLARKVFTTAQPMLRGQLRQLEALASIDGSTVVRRRTGATCTLRAMDGEIRVLLADRELSLPPMAGSALDHVTSRERFAVSELHPMLDPESALVLVRRLVREGLLEVVFDA
jgi:ribosomal protein L16 Arg81 hydroxylase